MKIKLSNGYSLVPEGTHIFKITDVEYKEDFGKLNITLTADSGQTHIERFSFISKSGQTNDGALAAFSFFARTAMNDFGLEDIEPADLLGKYIECDVTHEEVEDSKNPGKYKTYSRLGEKRPASGFNGETPAEASDQVSTGIDLDSLLGNL